MLRKSVCRPKKNGRPQQRVSPQSGFYIHQEVKLRLLWLPEQTQCLLFELVENPSVLSSGSKDFSTRAARSKNNQLFYFPREVLSFWKLSRQRLWQGRCCL